MNNLKENFLKLRKEMMEKRKAEHMAQMEKDLNLTKAQVSQIKTIPIQQCEGRQVIYPEI